MRLKNYFLGVALCSTFIGLSQSQHDSDVIEVNGPSSFFITAPMTTFPQVNPAAVEKREVPKGGITSKSIRRADAVETLSKSSSSQDPFAKQAPAIRIGRAPIVNFDAIAIDISPPDPTAAVGPNHVVQMTNGVWSVYDKTGIEADGFPKDLNDPLGGEVKGDPVVLYDREADRWFISQFQDPTEGEDPSQFRIAISTTPDPTGSYAVFSYDVPPNDYPHFGIWGNSYVVTGNFNPEGTGRFYAFNRQKMIDGDATAEIATLTLPNYEGGGGFQAPQPVHSEGAGIAAGPAPIVWYQDDSFPDITEDHVKVWNLDIDWENPAGAVVSEPIEVAMAAFDAFLEGTGDDSLAVLEQPGTTQRIDPIVGAMYFQAHRYSFGDHESLLFNFPVEITDGTQVSGVRWVELRRATQSEPWSLYQEGTLADPNGESIFLSAIAMDQEGNIGLAYTKVGATTFPSLYYTGRFDDDTLGQMTIAETLIIAGDGSITENSRYGDYSQLTRDPVDDLTFWFTAEYSGEPRKTRIASFKISETLSVDELDINASQLNLFSKDNNIFEVQLNTPTTSDILRLSVIDITGKRVYKSQVSKEIDGVYKAMIDLSSLSAGVYIVTIGNAKTKLNKKIIVK